LTTDLHDHKFFPGVHIERRLMTETSLTREGIMNVGRRLDFVLLSIVSAVALVGHAGQDPQAVSPGAADRIVEVEGRCPAFTWEAVQEAQAIELVAYRLPGTVDVAGFWDVDLTEADEVLYARLPGGASAWTPSLTQCLEPGERYVWFVRAVSHEEAADVIDAGEWSSAKFFTVSAVPTALEVEEALDVLSRYVGAGDEGPVDVAQPVERTRLTARRQQPGHARAPSAGEVKAVTTAKTAIKGRQTDISGETYGVVGISDSPAGAGLGAANMNGGADLVLDGTADGAADTTLSEAGIERASASAQTFTIDNPSGAMTLQVNGTISGSALTCPGCVAAAELAPGAVQNSHLANDAVTAAKIGANQVGGSEIAASAVGTSEIADGGVRRADLYTIHGVWVECDGGCDDSNVWDLCRHIGSGKTGMPIAVVCNNVQEFSSPPPCPGGGNNKCVSSTFNSETKLDYFCDDTSGFDAIVFCLQY
jgi:hypothetical protein